MLWWVWGINIAFTANVNGKMYHVIMISRHFLPPIILFNARKAFFYDCKQR